MQISQIHFFRYFFYIVKEHFPIKCGNSNDFVVYLIPSIFIYLTFGIFIMFVFVSYFPSRGACNLDKFISAL